MNLGQRLRRFIDRLYGSQKIFAKVVGISRPVLNRYIQGQNQPGADCLAKFQEAGLSIDWLLNGNGKMLNDNSSLVKELNESDNYNMLPQSRLKKWILDNFDSLENYAFLINYDLRVLENILNIDYLPDVDFINLVAQSGCSILWLSTGEGEQYENNYLGMILKMRKENPDKYVKDEIKIDMRKVNDLSTSQFYEAIKLMVQEQLARNNGDKNELE